MRCPGCDHDNIQGVDLCDGCGMDLAGLDVKAWGVDPSDPLLTTPLGRVPLKRPPTVPNTATVADAIQVMREQHEGCVFVLNEVGALVGVFTERDVTLRVAARGRDPQRTPLIEVMTHQPTTLDREDPLAWAMHRMGVDGYRHVPVTADGELVGLLSSRTLLRLLMESSKSR